MVIVNEIIDLKTIFLDENFESKGAVLRDIAINAFKLKIVDSEADALKELKKREEMLSTYVDKKIAIPHCKSNIVKSSKVLIYRFSKEIRWGEDENVNLVFAILTNENGKEHLSILAKLARNLLKETFLEKVKLATTPNDIYVLLNNILKEE